ncbi:MAG: molybdopterin synthase catalytic subunit MoaE [Pseudohongiella sp.]|nr:molybdopterin synthase catalytic subunit MoaE [Pseudohongiella sp.]MDP2127654.1 molybdopterin synthase catalytic subunit MoaE [Pseudohongiella sp.]
MTANTISPVPIHIRVQQQDFDMAAEYAALRTASGNPGAIVVFTGLVREILDTAGVSTGTGKEQSLTLEHYPGMTESALQKIAQQAVARWPLQAISIIHRVGTLKPGDQIVLVAASSAHRSAAFESADFMMDYLKTSAPFWKKQLTRENSHWVQSRESDYQAVARWQAAEIPPTVKD